MARWRWGMRRWGVQAKATPRRARGAQQQQSCPSAASRGVRRVARPRKSPGPPLTSPPPPPPLPPRHARAELGLVFRCPALRIVRARQPVTLLGLHPDNFDQFVRLLDSDARAQLREMAQAEVMGLLAAASLFRGVPADAVREAARGAMVVSVLEGGVFYRCARSVCLPSPTAPADGTAACAARVTRPTACQCPPPWSPRPRTPPLLPTMRRPCTCLCAAWSASPAAPRRLRRAGRAQSKARPMVLAQVRPHSAAAARASQTAAPPAPSPAKLLSPGDVFGDLELLTRSARRMGAVAVSPCVAVRLLGASVLAAADACPELRSTLTEVRHAVLVTMHACTCARKQAALMLLCGAARARHAADLWRAADATAHRSPGSAHRGARPAHMPPPLRHPLASLARVGAAPDGL